jgi:uncharacterized protein (TIRG00374 family)
MRGNYKKVGEIFATANILLFICGVLIFFIAVLIAATRLKIIIQAQDLNVSFLEAVGLTFIGYFFNNFLPTSIGGDVVKAYYVGKKTGTKAASYASVFMDRFLGLFTMVLMAAAALLLVKGFVKDKTVFYMIYGAIAFSAVFLVFIFNRNFAARFSFLLKLAGPIEEKLRKLYGIIHGYQKHRFLLAQSITISFFSQIAYFYSMAFLALSVGTRIPMKELFLRMPLVSALSMLPSINGLGVREGSVVALFSPLIGKESAFAVSILMLAMLMLTSLFGGLVYALSPQFRVKLPREE